VELAVLSQVAIAPLVYEIGLRGYVFGRFRSTLGPIEASIVTALGSAACVVFPERLPFDFALALALCELRRRSNSLVLCLLASSLHGAALLWLVRV
jgi:hypothetical protein